MSEITEILDRLSPILGHPVGEPVPLEGGITNRNYKVRFGGDDYVVRVPGKDTNLLEIDRLAEPRRQPARSRGRGGPQGRGDARGAALPGGAVPRRAHADRRGAAPAGVARGRRGRPAAHPHPSRRCPASSRRSGSSRPTRARRRSAGPGCRTSTGRRASARLIEAALTGPEHAPVPCHNDLLAANFLHDGERLWIVDWEYAGMGDRYFDLGNFAVNNELGQGGGGPVDRVLQRAADAQAPAALGLMRFMSDFREAMWGVVQTAASELDFDFTGYAAEHFDRLWSTAPRPLRGAGRARPPPDGASEMTLRRRALRGGRRRGRRHEDRLPPGEARLGRRRPARSQPAHAGRPSTPRAWWASSEARFVTKMMMYSGSTSTGGLRGESEFDPGWTECGGLRLASSPSGWRSCATRPAGRRLSGCRWS